MGSHNFLSGGSGRLIVVVSGHARDFTVQATERLAVGPFQVIEFSACSGTYPSLGLIQPSADFDL